MKSSLGFKFQNISYLLKVHHAIDSGTQGPTKHGILHRWAGPSMVTPIGTPEHMKPPFISCVKWGDQRLVIVTETRGTSKIVLVHENGSRRKVAVNANGRGLIAHLRPNYAVSLVFVAVFVQVCIV